MKLGVLSSRLIFLHGMKIERMYLHQQDSLKTSLVGSIIS